MRLKVTLYRMPLSVSLAQMAALILPRRTSLVGFAFVMVFPFFVGQPLSPQRWRLLFPFRRNHPFGGDNGVRSPWADEPGWPFRKGGGTKECNGRRAAGRV